MSRCFGLAGNGLLECSPPASATVAVPAARLAVPVARDGGVEEPLEGCAHHGGVGAVGEQQAEQDAGLAAVEEPGRDESAGEQVPLGAGKAVGLLQHLPAAGA